MYAGDSQSITVTVLDDTGAIFDLTGWTVRFSAVAGATTIVKTGTTAAPTSGVTVIDLDPVDTASLTADITRFVYSVRITSGADVRTVTTGTLVVEKAPEEEIAVGGLLSSADFADLIDAQLLINLTGGTSSPDENVIAKVSAAAWDEMFGFLGERYTKPATCPDGLAKELLRKVTRYGLYSRRPELLATPEGEMIRLERKDALALCEKAAKGDASIAGLALLDADALEDAGTGAVYYANDVVYGPTTYRGF